jgi:hypothetical protein
MLEGSAAAAVGEGNNKQLHMDPLSLRYARAVRGRGKRVREREWRPCFQLSTSSAGFTLYCSRHSHLGSGASVFLSRKLYSYGYSSLITR